MKSAIGTREISNNFFSIVYQMLDLSASIPILWKCFHFHGYFSFPLEPQRLDYCAFQRAISFLAADGNHRLGTIAKGSTCMYDDDAPNVGFKIYWIMFRSLATPWSHSIGPSSAECEERIIGRDLANTEEDLMEVLFTLTQPEDPCIRTGYIEELRPYARKILGSWTQYDNYSIAHKDFLSLLKLILNIQPEKPQSGPNGRILTHLNSTLFQDAASAITEVLVSGGKKDVDWHVFMVGVKKYLV